MNDRNPSRDTIALKGQADTSQDLALDVLAKRLKQMEQNQRLEAVQQAALREEQDDMIREFRQEVIAEKEQTNQALGMILAKLEKVMDQKPNDPETENQWRTRAADQAKQQSTHKRAVMSKQLKDAPLGQIVSHNPIPQMLQINGHQFLVQPGVNVDVPMPFVDFWTKAQEDQVEGAKQIALIQRAREFGNLQNVLQDQTMDDGKNYGQWDEEHGAI